MRKALIVTVLIFAFVRADAMSKRKTPEPAPSPAPAVASCTPLRSCSASITTACETPTPVVRCDPSSPGSTGSPIAGYALYYRASGATTWTKLSDLGCYVDPDDPTSEIVCRLPKLGVPVQRYCDSCVEGRLYEFAVKAYDAAGRYSLDYSHTVTSCWRHVWQKPERYE